MAKRSRKPVAEEVPLYIRWSPDRSVYSIELRLELVRKIAAQVSLSQQAGIELGGFLIGSFPVAPVPTLRIDDLEMVANDSDDDTVFLPGPKEYEALPDLRGRVRQREATLVGFFRTHARTGPMRPSPADRSLLAQEFKDTPYVALLVRSQNPHTAAFFVAAKGQLPNEPSVREFEFDEDEFKALPEVSVESKPEEEDEAPRRFFWGQIRTYATITGLLLMAALACVLMWDFAKQATPSRWFESSNQLHLAIVDENRVGDSALFRISWDHSARALNQSTGATLVVKDGALRSELVLGMDDLRLGAVEYQGTTASLNVQLILHTQDGQKLGDTAEWNAQ